jgi:hypothetical protein
MNLNFSDPVVLICAVVVVVGILLLFWAVSALRNSNRPDLEGEIPPLEASAGETDLLIPPAQDAPLSEDPIFSRVSEPEPPLDRTPVVEPEPLPKPAPVPTPVAAKPFSAPVPSNMPIAPSGSSSAAGAQPGITREVADRLEVMNQRLAEMQSVLSKSGTTAPQPGGMGQGFAPETVDKLLKIIGNVIVQVDILQRSLNVSKDVAAPKSPASAPAASQTPAPATPVLKPMSQQPATGAPTGPSAGNSFGSSASGGSFGGGLTPLSPITPSSSGPNPK